MNINELEKIVELGYRPLVNMPVFGEGWHCSATPITNKHLNVSDILHIRHMQSPEDAVEAMIDSIKGIQFNERVEK